MTTSTLTGALCLQTGLRLVVGAIVLGSALPAAAQGPMRLTSPPSGVASGAAITASNWLSVGVARPWLEGNSAQFMQRHRVPDGAWGGVDDMHLERLVGERGVMTIDGRLLLAKRDYDLRLGVEDPEVGYVQAGARAFRTWYDGSGGFFPPNAATFQPFPEALAMDRGSAWIGGALTLPSLPRLSVRYSRMYRKGEKPSLVWGETNLTGLTGTSAARALVPSFWQSDETRNVVEGDLEHKAGPLDVHLGLRYEVGDIRNTRNMLRRPDEPQERFVSQADADAADQFSAHATTQFRLHPRALLTTSYAYTSVAGDVSGSRIYGATFGAAYNPGLPARQQRDAGYLNLAGTTQVTQQTASVNLRLTPWQALTVVPSLRVEKRAHDAASEYTGTNVGSPPLLTATQTRYTTLSERARVDLTGRVEARYTGLPHVVLYSRADWLDGAGDLMERERNLVTLDTTFRRVSDDRRFTQKYVIGGTWYARRRLNLGGQLYRRHQVAQYVHPVDPLGPTRYSGFLTMLDVVTEDANVQLRWQPIPGLSLSSRYDVQRSTFEGASMSLPQAESGRMRSKVFSQTVAWVPLTRYYVQGQVNVVRNHVSTPAQDLTGAAADLVPEARNDYVNASLSATYALTNKVDLEGQYLYFTADDYVDNSQASQPFGSSFHERGLSVGVAAQLTDRLRWMVRYVGFHNGDDTPGSRDSYDLRLVYTSVQVRF